ncbi:MAG: Maf family protein [Anaeromyxobacteraceae bacterium]
MPRLVLASQSPRRRELLAGLGLALDVRPAHADESQRPGEAPADYVLRVARDKARAVPGDVVLGADTAVVVRGAILGKPADEADARRMLRALSGEVHEVLTGVCVRRNAGTLGVELDAVVSTEVRFQRLTTAQIDWYVSTGEPLDKAGAYALQGAGGVFVAGVEGSVSNVIGLPLGETVDLLRHAGFPLPWESP